MTVTDARFAIGLLLIPPRSIWYVLLAAAASIVLILIHHIQFLMYVPTIVVIVVLRHYLDTGRSRDRAGSSAGPRLLAVGVLFPGRAI